MSLRAQVLRKTFFGYAQTLLSSLEVICIRYETNEIIKRSRDPISPKDAELALWFLAYVEIPAIYEDGHLWLKHEFRITQSNT